MESKNILMLVLMIILLSSIVYAANPNQCDAAQVKVALKKVLYQYYRDPSSTQISVDRIRDLLAFYLSIPSNEQYADCNLKGSESNKKMQQIIDEINALLDTLPQCKDKTVYGECSSTLPLYCFNGNLVNKCSICGCPSGTTCVDNSCVSTVTPPPSPPPPVPNATNGTITPPPITPVCGDTICSGNETCTSCATDCGSCPIASGNFTEIRITTDPSVQSLPAIYGNKIVWYDERNGYSDIYSYDLLTREERALTNAPDGGDRYPQIYGNKVVFERAFMTNSNIYLYDFDSGKEQALTTNNNSAVPRIYENKIGWFDNYRLYLYDLSTKQGILIMNNTNYLMPASIYGNYVVWTTSPAVYIYDFTTGEKKMLSPPTNGISQRNPVINQDRVFWSEEGQLYMYDLSKGQKQKISTTIPVYELSVYGDKIVYESPDYNIILYDLSTNTEKKVTTSGLINDTSLIRNSRPAIYGNTIVWLKTTGLYRPREYDIYMTTIS